MIALFNSLMAFPQGACGQATGPHGHMARGFPQGACANGANGDYTQGVIGSITLSNDATAEFISPTFSGELPAYEFGLQCIQPATDGATLWMRVSHDNGATWESGASDYYVNGYSLDATGGAIVTYASTANAIPICSTASGVGNAASETISGWIKTGTLSSTNTFKQFVWFTSWRMADGAPAFMRAGGQYYGDTAAVNAIQFFFGAGNLSGGKIKIKGKKGAV